MANLQAEKDLIQSMQTGQYVHTRTARDDYQRDLMISMAYQQAAATEETRKLAAIRGAPAVERKVAGMTMNELRTSREFQAAKEEAENLMMECQALRAEQRAVQKAGGTPESLAALDSRLEEKAAELNSSYMAKLLLKKRGGAGAPLEDTRLARDLAESVDKMYARRVDPVYRKAVDGAGYEWEELTETGWQRAGKLAFEDIRNASSKGTLNIDPDLALIEKDPSRFRIVKGGEEVSMSDVNQDLQRI